MFTVHWWLVGSLHKWISSWYDFFMIQMDMIGYLSMSFLIFFLFQHRNQREKNEKLMKTGRKVCRMSMRAAYGWYWINCEIERKKKKVENGYESDRLHKACYCNAHKCISNNCVYEHEHEHISCINTNNNVEGFSYIKFNTTQHNSTQHNIIHFLKPYHFLSFTHFDCPKQNGVKKKWIVERREYSSVCIAHVHVDIHTFYIINEQSRREEKI